MTVRSLAPRPPLAAGPSWADWGQRLNDWLALNLSPPPYADFEAAVTINLAAVNTAQVVTFDALSRGEGIDRGTPASRILFQEGGIYQVDFHANHTGGGDKWFWLRVNGADAGTAVIENTLHQHIALDRGDYLEVFWAADAAAAKLEAVAATAFAPACPAAGLTITRIHR